jgi:hypothetical protein
MSIILVTVRIVSRLCRWLNPNWIDAYAVGCISVHALSSGLTSLFLVRFASEPPFVGKSD